MQRLQWYTWYIDAYRWYIGLYRHIDGISMVNAVSVANVGIMYGLWMDYVWSCMVEICAFSCVSWLVFNLFSLPLFVIYHLYDLYRLYGLYTIDFDLILV